MESFIQVFSLMFCLRLRCEDVANKRSHPKEWEKFLTLCIKQDFDNPLFKHYRDLFFSGAKVDSVESLRTIKPIKVTKPDGTTEIHMGRKKLAEKLEIYPNVITQWNGKVLKKGRFKGWRFDVLPRPIPIYALYEDDDLLGIGTADELSREQGITLATFEFYLYQTSRPDTSRRVLLVDWELQEEEVE